MRTFFFILFLSAEFISAAQTDAALFEEFRSKYGKKYTTPEELNYRYELFKKSLALLNNEPNSVDSKGKILLGSSFSTAPKRSYSMGINEFADLSDVEFQNFYLLPHDILYSSTTAQESPRPKYGYVPTQYRPQMYQGYSNPYYYTPVNPYSLLTGQSRYLQSANTEKLKGLPRKMSWREKGVISPIKNQKKCNSCYAFASIAAVEAWNKKLNLTGTEEILSEQEILDCSQENKECEGGQPSASLQYIIDNGVSHAKDYPYQAKKSKACIIKKKSNADTAGRLLAETNKTVSKTDKPSNETASGQKKKTLLGFDIFNGGMGGDASTSYYGGGSSGPSYYGGYSQYSPYQTAYGGNAYQNQYSPSNSYYSQYPSYSQQYNTPTAQTPYSQNSMWGQTMNNMYSNQYQTPYYQSTNPSAGYGNLVPSQPAYPPAVSPTPQTPVYPSQTQPTRPPTPPTPPASNTRPPTPTPVPSPVPVNIPVPLPPSQTGPVPVPPTGPSQTPVPIPTPVPVTPVVDPADPFAQNVNSANDNRFSKLSFFRFVEPDIQELITEVSKGPVVAAHYVSNEMKFYKTGVFNGDGCGGKDTVNHSVLVVGYDLDAEVPYLELKNSWGPDWGDNGFYKIAIGDLQKKNGTCLISGTNFNVVPEFDN